MKWIKRFIYLGYYIKELNWSLYWKFVTYTAQFQKKSKLRLILSSVQDSFRFNVSLLEYFQFHFYQISEKEKESWAGTGFMYETILKLNPPRTRVLLSDKKQFARHYKDFIRHSSQSIHEWLDSYATNKNLQAQWILKPSDGQCGRGILKVESANKTIEEIYQMALSSGNDIIEPYLEQHEALQYLSASGLNTLRIITQINKKGEVDILGIRLRITVNNLVDNMAAGNIAAPVDEVTGKITGPGVYSDITKTPENHHPVTGKPIIGFQVPYFKEALDLAKKAALHDTRNTSIGWDIAILQDGPDILEGNHDWCKLLWQLPVQRGLKAELMKYI